MRACCGRHGSSWLAQIGGAAHGVPPMQGSDGERPYTVLVCVEALRPKLHSKGLVMGKPRRNAAIKDSAWVMYVLANR